MIGGIVNAPLLEPCFRPSPKTLNRIERTRVAPVENHLDAALSCFCLDSLCAVNPEIINKHDALASTHVVRHLLKEVAVRKLVDGFINYMDSDDLTVHVDCCSDSNRFESQLFFFNHHGFALWCVPNFWLNLIGRKYRFVHEQELLPCVYGLKEPRERK